jgi:hypothetical protein
MQLAVISAIAVVVIIIITTLISLRAPGKRWWQVL